MVLLRHDAVFTPIRSTNAMPSVRFSPRLTNQTNPAQKPHQYLTGVDGPKEVATALDDEDGFVFVQDDDTLHALSDFVAKSVSRYPKVKGLSQKQLRKMLTGTFAVLKEPSQVSKLWGWGQFAYTTWGWATFAMNIYKEPAMAKLVASGAWKAMSWVLVFVL